MQTATARGTTDHRRKGATAITLAVAAPLLLGFAALAVDMGYLHNARIDLQNAADAAALAGATGLAHIDNLYYGGTSPTARQAAYNYAIQFAASNNAAGKAVTLSPNPNNLSTGDVVLGFLEHPESATGELDLTNPLKFNAVRVTARRTSGSTDGAVGLFFARVMGFSTAQLTATATAVLDSRFVTYQPPAEGRGALIPITVHQNVWNEYIIQRRGPDDYGFSNGDIQHDGDGVPELLLYPWPRNTPGNFGLLHVGDPEDFSGSGGTTRISNQIVNGISQDDLIDFHGQPIIDVYDTNGSARSYDIDGDTGLRAALETALETRMGQVIGFFIHDNVSGQGTGTMYHVVRIQFARLVYVELNTGEKAVFVQPVPYTSDEIGTGGNGQSTQGMIGNIQLVR